jgi:hypothetical protein
MTGEDYKNIIIKTIILKTQFENLLFSQSLMNKLRKTIP